MTSSETVVVRFLLSLSPAKTLNGMWYSNITQNYQVLFPQSHVYISQLLIETWWIPALRDRLVGQMMVKYQGLTCSINLFSILMSLNLIMSLIMNLNLMNPSFPRSTGGAGDGEISGCNARIRYDVRTLGNGYQPRIVSASGGSTLFATSCE